MKVIEVPPQAMLSESELIILIVGLDKGETTPLIAKSGLVVFTFDIYHVPPDPEL